MKFIAATFFLSLASCSAFGQDKAAVSAAEAPCGPRDRDFSVTAVESHRPTPIPASGKALIYVVPDAPDSTRVGANGKRRLESVEPISPPPLTRGQVQSVGTNSIKEVAQWKRLLVTLSKEADAERNHFKSRRKIAQLKRPDCGARVR